LKRAEHGVYSRRGTIRRLVAADRMLRWMLALGLFSALSIGCGRKPDAEFMTWAQAPQVYAPQPGSSNAFDDYALAAQRAEQLGGTNLDRVNFFPGHRIAAEKDLGQVMQQVSAATSKTCEFRFTPAKPFEDRPYVRGWRLIGRIYAWRVEDACKAEDFDKAISNAVTGTKFAMDLTGGDAVQASLGLAIADDIRKAIAPNLDKMDSAHLMLVADGMTQALARRADPAKTIANERQNMLLAVQTVQDAYKSNDLKQLQTQLGPSAKDGLDYLEALHSQNSQKALDFFRGFAAEAETLAAHATTNAALPTKDRTKPELPKERPWKRIARHFFGTLQPLLAMEDETLARNRLLIVTSRLRAEAKKNIAPTIDGLDKSIAIDPYSGKPFVLHSDDTEFSVYSVGADLKDDGGETDTSFTKPDLELEQP
jgi:hypothetical protein